MAPMMEALPAVICARSSRSTSGWRSGCFAELSCEQSTRMDFGRPAFARSCSVFAMWAGEQLGPEVPPRRTMWQSGLPRVTMAEAEPLRLMPRKVCGCAAARMALIAVAKVGGVPGFFVGDGGGGGGCCGG